MTLHDIFPTVEIVEYSLYYFILFSFLLMVGLWYLGMFYQKHKKRTRGYYITLLEKSIEENAKHTAHKFTYYGKRVVRTTEQKEKLLQLLEMLEPFKYQQGLDFFDESTKKELANFLQALRYK